MVSDGGEVGEGWEYEWSGDWVRVRDGLTRVKVGRMNGVVTG